MRKHNRPAILKMRRQGLLMREIGDQIGVGVWRASQLCQSALREACHKLRALEDRPLMCCDQPLIAPELEDVWIEYRLDDIRPLCSWEPRGRFV